MSTSPLKPSPLAPIHSSTPPRTSPFRRQNSSASASNSPINGSSNANGNNNNAASFRSTTPTSGAQSTRPATPSKLQSASTPNHDATTFSPRLRGGGASLNGAGPDSPTKPPYSATDGSLTKSSTFDNSPRTVRGVSPQPQQRSQTFPSPNPPLGSSPSFRGSSSSAAANLDALSSLPPALVRSLRDAFSLLDRDNTGTLTPADVAAMHAQLGLPAPTQMELSAYFPPGAPTPLALPAFLGGLAAPLAKMDSSEELLAALGAFDERETGQVSVEEIVDAVGGGGQAMSREDVETVMKGFTGRPKLSRNLGASTNGNSGEVFRYREWVGSLGLNGERNEKGQAVEG